MHWLNETEIAATIPECVARENNCVPIIRIGPTLIVAAANPASLSLRDKLSFILDQPVRLLSRNCDWIRSKIDSVFLDALDDSTAECQIDRTIYWANWTWRDGPTFFVKASGSHGTSRWSGALELPVDHPDRAFWEWVATLKSYQRLIDDRELTAMRRIWHRMKQRTQKS